MHGVAVELAVGLGAWAANGGAFAGVEDSVVDAGAVDSAPHDAVQRVDFFDERSFGNAADGGVARHFTDGGLLLRN